MAYLRYTFRLKPTSNQRRVLTATLEAQRQLYNELLDWRIYAWDVYHATITPVDMMRWLPHQRRQRPEMSQTLANIQRGTIQKLDRAYQRFFQRCRANEHRKGHPRFKSENSFNSFEFAQWNGMRFDGKRLKFKGMPGWLKLNGHRRIPSDGKLCSAIIKRKAGRWHLVVSIKFADQPATTATNPVGIDMGISHLAALSTGEYVPNARYEQRAAAELRRANRKLSRCQLSSNRRQKVKAERQRRHAKVTNSRRTYLHQVSRNLVNRFDLIAVERLTIDPMVHGRLAPFIYDAAWNTLRFMLTYKASCAGRRVVAVESRYTSQECSQCHELVPKDLSVRIHSCLHCGLVLCRDVNSARVVLHRAVSGPDRLNHEAACGAGGIAASA